MSTNSVELHSGARPGTHADIRAVRVQRTRILNVLSLAGAFDRAQKQAEPKERYGVYGVRLGNLLARRVVRSSG